MYRTIVATALTGTTAIGLGAVALPASADARPAATHCVASVTDGLIGCYATMADADRAVAAHRTVQLAILYNDTGWSPAHGTMTLVQTHGCTRTTSDVDWQIADLRVIGWNQRIGSFVTRSHCDLKGWDGFNFRGDHFKRYVDHDIKLTRWNNDISSLKLS